MDGKPDLLLFNAEKELLHALHKSKGRPPTQLTEDSGAEGSRSKSPYNTVAQVEGLGLGRVGGVRWPSRA